MESVSAHCETVASEGLEASVSGHSMCVVYHFMTEGSMKSPFLMHYMSLHALSVVSSHLMFRLVP